MDKGKNSFEVKIGTSEDYQLVKVNLTSSFDGIALPSDIVSPNLGTFYKPQQSSTHQDIDDEKSLIDSHKGEQFNMSLDSSSTKFMPSTDSHPSIEPDFFDDLMIDNNIFGQKKMQNYVAFHAENEELNSTMQFYFLTEEKESSGYELYKGGGYFGVTPSSWHSEMGLFHQFKHVKQ